MNALAQLSKDEFLALQNEAEGIELENAQGRDTPRGDARLAEITTQMDESPWTLHPDYGCVLSDELAALDTNHQPQS